jgi:dynein heavy chain 1
MLTLPNGERLNLPSNVRIMFEVETLKYATLATVSRCGMIWFSDNVVSPIMLMKRYLLSMRSVALDDADEELAVHTNPEAQEVSKTVSTQRICADFLEPFFLEEGLVAKSLQFVSTTMPHIMDFTSSRAMGTLFSLLNKSVRNVLEYNSMHMDFPLSVESIHAYLSKRLIFSLIWSFSGDAKLDERVKFGEYLRGITMIDMPPAGLSVIDYDINLATGEWNAWQNKVPQIEIETHMVIQSDVVIPTVDTIRHEEVLYSWLSEHKPLVLCGPPGSGKTMTLFSALRKLPEMEVAGLNFSSATTPELVLKVFDQYCEYRRTPNGVILSPVALGKWLVVFCDEINLPANDKYGTQRVISFMRQLVEKNGFWRTSDRSWVTLERIQFVGACNPPTVASSFSLLIICRILGVCQCRIDSCAMYP